MILGIDEAGRGPSIGPMVMCGAVLDDNNIEILDSLKNMGVKDSKKLSPEKRVSLYKILKQKKVIVDYFILKIPAYKIDEALRKDGDSLNLVETRAQIKIISELLKNNKVDKIIIDCPSINAVSYKHKLIELMKKSKVDFKNSEIFCEHKADQNYIVVSAASIFAKVVRDHEIEKLQRTYKKTEYGNLGSGYSSDILTIEFIKNNYERLSDDKNLFRKEWQTYKDILKEKNQKKLNDF